MQGLYDSNLSSTKAKYLKAGRIPEYVATTPVALGNSRALPTAELVSFGMVCHMSEGTP
jgi:hypothetical protein